MNRILKDSKDLIKNINHMRKSHETLSAYKVKRNQSRLVINKKKNSKNEETCFPKRALKKRRSESRQTVTNCD